MVLNGVKDNKCFEPIPTATGVKYKASQTVTLPASMATGTVYPITFEDDAILATDTAIVTMVYSSMNVTDVIIAHYITAGTVLVTLHNDYTSSQEITVNCAVI